MLLFSRGHRLNIPLPATRTILTVVVAVLCLGQSPAAQNVTHALFGRYIDALRQQIGIPGISAAIIRAGASAPEWSQGFGLARIEDAVPMRPDTPLPIAGLSQSIGAALTFRHCIATGEVTLADLVQRWSPNFPEGRATFADVLAHRQNGTYAYRPERFASGLTRAVEECADRPYANVVFDEVIAPLKMEFTVPGADVSVSNSNVQLIFPSGDLRRFNQVLLGLARGYRVDANRRATLSDYRPSATTLSAGDGLISSASDLAIFEAALDRGFVVPRRLLEDLAWRRHAGGVTGYGWFVQQVNGKSVIWQFGEERDAYSSLMIKLPQDGLTLVLLANSDGLTRLFPLANGDVTVSPFAAIFFNLLG